jgi:hypothetical protein
MVQFVTGMVPIFLLAGNGKNELAAEVIEKWWNRCKSSWAMAPKYLEESCEQDRGTLKSPGTPDGLQTSQDHAAQALGGEPDGDPVR